MSLDSKNPEWEARADDWRQMRDTYEGEKAVKAKGPRYLPPTRGMVADGFRWGDSATARSEGTQNYNAYLLRAVYPELVDEAVQALLGVMHQKPPMIQLPESMEPLLDDATDEHETLEQLLRRINEQQLVFGRLGLLGDVIDTGPKANQTYIVLHQALPVGNWDEGRSDDENNEQNMLNMVIIDESEPERQSDFEWKQVRKHRVLLLGDPEEQADTVQNEVTDPLETVPAGAGTYVVGVFRDALDFDPSQMEAPTIRGETLNEIPFVFVNTKDLVAQPDKPPLLPLSNLTLTIYRGEGDYRQSLFAQGQDTLVIIGTRLNAEDSDQTRVGAGALLELSQGSDAKFIGVDSSGLPEQRVSLENDYARASSKGAQLLENTGEVESGEALRVRVAAKTATLQQIALTGAAGLQRILRILARWMGADPEQVVVIPNTDFTPGTIEGRTVVDYMSAKAMGAPWSYRSIHGVMQDRNLTKLTFDDEKDEIERELQDGTTELLTGSSAAASGSTSEEGPESSEEEEGVEEAEAELEPANNGNQT